MSQSRRVKQRCDTVLVTGGLGFIGSHTVDALVSSGYRVRVLDNVCAQIHGNDRRIPQYANRDADITIGDVEDRQVVSAALEGVDAVFHFAAETGVGQSMYEIGRYVSVNVTATSTLLDEMIRRRNENGCSLRLILASSRAVYGEGKYACERCGPFFPETRSKVQLEQHQWDILCPHCGLPGISLPTDEQTMQNPLSIYAATKRSQEDLCRVVSMAYDIPTVILRYFNVYGPRQSMSNPYTGVLSIFAARLLDGQAPLVLEDGRESRDFVYVEDIVRANVLALEHRLPGCQTVNVGSGESQSIQHVADLLSTHLGGLPPKLLPMARVGDIRHCTADIKKARELLGYRPEVSFRLGLERFVKTAWGQTGVDKLSQALDELAQAGLLLG